MTPDTNVLVRAVVGDDTAQTQAAREAIRSAPLLVLSMATLCELSWVLRSIYRLPRRQIAATIAALTEGPNVVADTQAVASGLALLEAGGDFADGVIAAQGSAMGGETFLSFDRKAVRLLAQAGHSARLLA